MRSREEAPKEGEEEREKARGTEESRAKDGQVLSLGIIEPEPLSAVEGSEWEELDLAVDSGASETVIGEGMLKGVEVKEGTAKKRGVQYEVADGTLLPNLGSRSSSP